MNEIVRERFNQIVSDIIDAIEASVEPATDVPLSIVRKNCKTYSDAEKVMESVCFNLRAECGKDAQFAIARKVSSILSKEKSRQIMSSDSSESGFFD